MLLRFKIFPVVATAAARESIDFLDAAPALASVVRRRRAATIGKQGCDAVGGGGADAALGDEPGDQPRGRDVKAKVLRRRPCRGETDACQLASRTGRRLIAGVGIVCHHGKNMEGVIFWGEGGRVGATE